MLSLSREGVEAQRACLVLAPGAFISHKKKYYASSKSSSHQLRKSPSCEKAPSPERKRGVSEDQEGCRQTS